MSDPWRSSSTSLRRQAYARPHWTIRAAAGAYRLLRDPVGFAAVAVAAVLIAGTVWWGVTAAAVRPAAAPAVSRTTDDPERGVFDSCSIAREPCVIDGRTFRYAGAVVELADIAVPLGGESVCRPELEAAERARDALARLLSDGGFTLTSASTGKVGRGRVARIATRKGKSLGAALIRQGLADPAGHRRDWCSS